MFWVLAAAMLLAGLAFFLPPLRGRTRVRSGTRGDWNLLIHKQRRAELAAEISDAAQAAEIAEELDRDLLADVETSMAAPLAAPTHGRAALATGLALALTVGIAMYLVLGRPQLAGVTPGSDPNHPTRAQIDAGIQELGEKLAKNPNDLDGWVLLARSLQATGRLEKAVTAYEFARKLAPDDLDLKALYAEALAEANGGSMSGQPATLVGEILAKKPEHRTALWLSGLAAAEERNYDTARELWQRLARQLPPGSEDAQELERYIAQLGAAGQDETPAGGGAAIEVHVKLADSLRDKAAPDDAVFIFARAAEGPPMPLAVVRKRVGDLPVEVRLDDSMAMMQGRGISSVDRIIVGARVSKSGKPTPSPGDLQGLTAPLSTRDLNPQTIEIRDVVP